MEKKEKITESLSPQELQEEADAIRALIDNEPELQDIHVTEEMDNRMMERIRKYEQEKAVENLSEEDREALRLGKELQKKRKKRYLSKSCKVYLVLAATLVLVIGVSVTGVGGKNIITRMLEKKFGDGDKTYVDSGKEVVHSDGINEEQIYADIKEAFGTDVVQIIYLPDDAEFKDMQLDKELQEAVLYYSVNEKIMSFRIVSRYVKSSVGMDLEDKLLGKYQIELPETTVEVKEYEIEETGESEYTASFTYKNTKYFVTGIMEKPEFEKIIKNLHFF